MRLVIYIKRERGFLSSLPLAGEEEMTMVAPKGKDSLKGLTG